MVSRGDADFCEAFSEADLKGSMRREWIGRWFRNVGFVQSTPHDFAFVVRETNFRSALLIEQFEFLKPAGVPTPIVKTTTPSLANRSAVRDAAFFRDSSPSVMRNEEFCDARLFRGGAGKTFIESKPGRQCREWEWSCRPTAIQSIFESAVIERERTFGERKPGRRIATRPRRLLRVTSHEISDGKFGALESAGSDVSGQHAAGNNRE